MTDKKFIALTLVGAFVVLIGAYFFISAGNKSSQPTTLVASYNSADKERPQAEVKQDSADLGSIKVSDQKSQDFLVKNIGKKPLQFSNITSSCGCTVGQVIYDGKTSDEFGMHSQSSEVFEIAPGKQATVRVIYRPYVMPVYGPVEREVYVETNDPANPKLVFKVNANVN